MRTSTLLNNETFRSTADFASTLSNFNNVEISDLFFDMRNIFEDVSQPTHYVNPT